LHLALHSLGCCNGSSFCDEAKLGSWNIKGCDVHFSEALNHSIS
jgi:hypothetical protein